MKSDSDGSKRSSASSSSLPPPISSSSLPSSKQQSTIVNVITPPASDDTQRAPLAEPEQTEHQNLKHRGSIWDTYIEMNDSTERKRRITRHDDRIDQPQQHLADLGKIIFLYHIKVIFLFSS